MSWGRHPKPVTIADIACLEIGDDGVAADHDGYWGYRVEPSDLDLLSNLDRVVDFDAKISNGAFDLRMPEQKLRSSEVACSPVDQNSLGAT